MNRNIIIMVLIGLAIAGLAFGITMKQKRDLQTQLIQEAQKVQYQKAYAEAWERFDIKEALRLPPEFKISIWDGSVEQIRFTLKGVEVLTPEELPAVCDNVKKNLVECNLRRQCPSFEGVKEYMIKWYKTNCQSKK